MPVKSSKLEVDDDSPGGASAPHPDADDASVGLDSGEGFGSSSEARSITLGLMQARKTPEQRKLEDLRILISLLKKINRLIGEKVKLEQTDIVEIAEDIRQIAWCEDDENCVRNKHGYRNRYKKKGGVVNKDGAKIDFEVLVHWIDYPNQEIFTNLFNENEAEIKKSLLILQEKIQFIIKLELTPELDKQLEIEGDDLNELEPDKDIGALIHLAAFGHDYLCFVRLLDLLSEFQKNNYDKLSLDKKQNRYQLGYLFSLLGETAKEISDFIKPENNQAKPDQDKVRFFFGRLGKYRQVIKDRPSIVREEICTLANMRDRLNEVLPRIKDMLDSGIKCFKDLCGENNLDLFIAGDFAEGIDKGYEQIEEDTRLLSIGTTFLYKKKRSLEESIARERTAISDITAEIGQNVEPSAGAGAGAVSDVSGTHDDMADFQQYAFNTKPAQQMIQQCIRCSEQDISDSTLSDQEQQLVHLLRQMQTIPEGSFTQAIELVVKFMPGYKKSLNSNLTRYLKVEIDDAQCVDYRQIFEECGVTGVQSLERSRQSQQDQLRGRLQRHQDQLKQNEEMCAVMEPYFDKYIPAHEAVQKPKQKAHEKHEKLIFIVAAEVDFLHAVHIDFQQRKQKNPRSYDLTVKMVVGFLGQWYKELLGLDSAKLSTFILKHSLLLDDMVHTMLVRHKHVSHDMYRCDDAVVEETVASAVLPWMDTFKHMRVLSHDAKSEFSVLYQLAPKDKRLFLDLQEGSAACPEIYTAYIMMRSYNEFLRSKDAVALYKATNLSGAVPAELRVEFYFQASLAYRNLNQFQDCVGVLDKALSSLSDIQDESIRDFKRRAVLCDLAIAKIQIYEYDDAQEILEGIVKNRSIDASFISPQELIVDILLNQIYMIKGFDDVGIVGLELLYLKFHKVLEEKVPNFLLGVTATLTQAYFARFDLFSARDFLNLYKMILRESRSKLVANSGQGQQYFELMLGSTSIRYDLLLAVLQEDAGNKRLCLDSVKEKWSGYHEKRLSNSFPYIEQTSKEDGIVDPLAVEILLGNYSNAKKLLPDSYKIDFRITIFQRLNQIRVRIIDMQLACFQFICSVHMSPILLGNQDFIYRHKKELQDYAVEVVHLYRVASMQALSEGQNEFAKTLIRESLVSMDLSGYIRHSFEAKWLELSRDLPAGVEVNFLNTVTFYHETLSGWCKSNIPTYADKLAYMQNVYLIHQRERHSADQSLIYRLSLLESDSGLNKLIEERNVLLEIAKRAVSSDMCPNSKLYAVEALGGEFFSPVGGVSSQEPCVGEDVATMAVMGQDEAVEQPIPDERLLVYLKEQGMIASDMPLDSFKENFSSFWQQPNVQSACQKFLAAGTNSSLEPVVEYAIGSAHAAALASCASGIFNNDAISSASKLQALIEKADKQFISTDQLRLVYGHRQDAWQLKKHMEQAGFQKSIQQVGVLAEATYSIVVTEDEYNKLLESVTAFADERAMEARQYSAAAPNT